MAAAIIRRDRSRDMSVFPEVLMSFSGGRFAEGVNKLNESYVSKMKKLFEGQFELGWTQWIGEHLVKDYRKGMADAMGEANRLYANTGSAIKAIECIYKSALNCSNGYFDRKMLTPENLNFGSSLGVYLAVNTKHVMDEMVALEEAHALIKSGHFMEGTDRIYKSYFRDIPDEHAKTHKIIIHRCVTAANEALQDGKTLAQACTSFEDEFMKRVGELDANDRLSAPFTSQMLSIVIKARAQASYDAWMTYAKIWFKSGDFDLGAISVLRAYCYASDWAGSSVIEKMLKEWGDAARAFNQQAGDIAGAYQFFQDKVADFRSAAALDVGNQTHQLLFAELLSHVINEFRESVVSGQKAVENKEE